MQLYAITDVNGTLREIVGGEPGDAVHVAHTLGATAVYYDGPEEDLWVPAPGVAVGNPADRIRDLDKLDPRKAPNAAHQAMGGVRIERDDVEAMDMCEAYELLLPFFKGLVVTRTGKTTTLARSPSQMVGGWLRGNYKTSKGHPSGEMSVQGLNLLPARMWAERGSKSRPVNFCIGASTYCEATCLVNSGRQTTDKYYTELKAATCASLLAQPVAFGRMLLDACLLHRGSSPGFLAPNENAVVPFVRLNVVSDVPWELVFPSLFTDLLPPEPGWSHGLSFYDYTKVPGRSVPPNYDLTFSYSGTNVRTCEKTLDAGGKVAVVFFKKEQRKGAWKTHTTWQGATRGGVAGPLPRSFLGAEVINGDITDVRPLDDKIAEGPPPWVVGLTYKTPRAGPGVALHPAQNAFVIPVWEVDGEIVTVVVPRATPGALETARRQAWADSWTAPRPEPLVDIRGRKARP